MGKSGSKEIKGQTRFEPLIAVVDDDDLMRRSTRRLLRSLGFRCETFSSAEDFLGARRTAQTDCLLLDVKMPGMGGLALQRHLAETACPIPIVFVSAQAGDEEEHRAMQAGAVRVLRKPVAKETLLLSLREALKIGPKPEEETP